VRLFTGISELVTPELDVIRNAAFAVDAGRVVWRGAAADWNGEASYTVDCGGRAVVPGLTDPHTHAIWAGDRLADFEARASGVGYEQILARGGGIRSTIRATAAATRQELIALARPRIEALIRSGATTIEVKSGYGFTPEAELRMLEAIAALADLVAARLVPTLLIHIPPTNAAERADYVDAVCHELIPQAAHRKLARALDIFVEREAWTADEARRMVRAARNCGLPFKLHTEQFHRVGGLELGLEQGALSVDHLEVCSPEQIAQLGRSGTIATILPGVTLHLGIPAAPGRALVDAGARVAVGTDLNPGSSPLFSIAQALALAVRLNGLSPLEALRAATDHAAAALGMQDADRADFLVLETGDWRDLVYTLGANPCREIWVGGEKIAL